MRMIICFLEIQITHVCTKNIKQNTELSKCSTKLFSSISLKIGLKYTVNIQNESYLYSSLLSKTMHMKKSISTNDVDLSTRQIKKQNITLSKHYQNSTIERGESDIANTYTTTPFTCLVQSLQYKMPGLIQFYGPKPMMELCSNLIKTPNTSAFIQRTYIYLDVDYFYLFQRKSLKYQRGNQKP